MALFQNMVRELWERERMWDLLFSIILGLEASGKNEKQDILFHEFTIAVILHIVEQ